MGISLEKLAIGRNNNFNLIRFIAASLVIFSHSFLLTGGTPDHEPLWASYHMTWGTMAVDIFFVSSGFLIAGSLMNRSDPVSFFWARFLRIYPAITVAVSTTIIICGTYFSTYSLRDYYTDPQTFWYFLKNVTLIRGIEYNLPGVFADVPRQYAVNNSLWTLVYEVKMYIYLAIIFYILMIIRNKWRRNIIVNSFLLIAAIAYILLIINEYIPFISRETIRLFYLFFCGAAFYFYRDKIILSHKIFAALFIILLISAVNRDLFFITFYLSLPYIIFYLAYIPDGKIREFNRIGDYSYGMYVFAYPIQQMIVSSAPGISVPFMIICSFCGALVVAFSSWHLIEKKCLKLKIRGSGKFFSQTGSF